MLLTTNILLGLIIFLLVIIYGGLATIERKISLEFRGSYGPIIRKVKDGKNSIDRR